MQATCKKELGYSLDELAALKLPGAPTTSEGWRLRANAEKWTFIEVKSRGRTGKKRLYVPPADIQELVESLSRGDLPAGDSYPEPAPMPTLKVQQERHYGVAEPGLSNSDAEINAHLFWLCHEACLQVHGEAFSKESVQVQINYAVDLYNLLLRLSSAKRANAGSNPQDFNRLDSEDMAAQLRLFVQMGWVKPFPPPPNHPKQLLF